MARAAYLFGAPIAAALSAAPVGNLLICLWLLMAAEVAVCLMLAQEWRAGPAAVAVRSDQRAVPRRKWVSS